MEPLDLLDHSQMSYSQPQKETDQKTVSKERPKAQKHKPIRKKEKKLKKEVSSNSTQSGCLKKQISMTPFNTQAQKIEILDEYFSGGMKEFYKTFNTAEQICITPEMVSENQLSLSDLFKKNISLIWNNTTATHDELISYLDLINKIQKAGNKFDIMADEDDRSFYCGLQGQNGLEMIQISKNEKQVLESRQIFRQKYLKAQEMYNMTKFTYETSALSEVSFEITHLYYTFNRHNKQLSQAFKNIILNIETQMIEEKEEADNSDCQDLYIESLIRMLIKRSVQDSFIDFINFFRDNEIKEHNLDSPLSILKNSKDFQDFMKRKKNCKFSKTARTILHTGCYVCFSSYYEQANPFCFCNECGVRFHKNCYSPIKINQKSSYCEGCYDKLLQKPSKSWKKQCQYCGTKGLLSISKDEKNSSHLLCLAINGCWRVKDKKIEQIEGKTNKLKKVKNRCSICGLINIYAKRCECCQNYAHATCAFLAGWKMQVEFSQSNNSAKPLIFRCCQNEQEKLKRAHQRKFILNYRKQSSKKIR